MQLNRKEFNSFRRRQVSAIRESRKQLVLRNNLEKRFYKRLNTLFRKFLNTNLYLYKEFGQYEPQIAQERLNEDFIPLMLSHYTIEYLEAIYKSNEDGYMLDRKADDTFVFGRSIDFENVVAQYFANTTN